MQTFTKNILLGLTLVSFVTLTDTVQAQPWELTNQLGLNYSWDIPAGWGNGNQGGWTEGDTVPHVASIDADSASGIGGNFFLDICFDAVVSNGPATYYGYVDLGNYDATLDPVIDLLDNPIVIDDTEGVVQSTNADLLSVTPLGLGGGTCDDASELAFRIEFTIPDSSLVTYLYYGGVLAKPGDTAPNDSLVTSSNSPSNKGGNWQTRAESGGDITTQIQSPDAIVLPVELVDFSARFDGSDAVLDWQTASETNNAGFSVEHSSNGAPFAEVGFVAGEGTTLDARDYSFRVVNVDAGTHQFRLKQIDFDGAFEYSAIIETASDVPGTHRLSSAYPNPFNPSTSFSLLVSVTQDVEIGLYDALGRQVRTVYDGSLDANVAKVFTVDADGLPSGTYMYVVRGANFRDSRSIVLLQ